MHKFRDNLLMWATIPKNVQLELIKDPANFDSISKNRNLDPEVVTALLTKKLPAYPAESLVRHNTLEKDAIDYLIKKDKRKGVFTKLVGHQNLLVEQEATLLSRKLDKSQVEELFVNSTNIETKKALLAKVSYFKAIDWIASSDSLVVSDEEVLENLKRTNLNGTVSTHVRYVVSRELTLSLARNRPSLASLLYRLSSDLDKSVWLDSFLPVLFKFDVNFQVELVEDLNRLSKLHGRDTLSQVHVLSPEAKKVLDNYRQNEPNPSIILGLDSLSDALEEKTIVEALFAKVNSSYSYNRIAMCVELAYSPVLTDTQKDLLDKYLKVEIYYYTYAQTSFVEAVNKAREHLGLTLIEVPKPFGNEYYRRSYSTTPYTVEEYLEFTLPSLQPKNSYYNLGVKGLDYSKFYPWLGNELGNDPEHWLSAIQVAPSFESTLAEFLTLVKML